MRQLLCIQQLEILLGRNVNLSTNASVYSVMYKRVLSVLLCSSSSQIY